METSSKLWTYFGAMLSEEKNGKIAASFTRVLGLILFLACLVLWILDTVSPKSFILPDSMLYTLWGLLGMKASEKIAGMFAGKVPAADVEAVSPLVSEPTIAAPAVPDEQVRADVRNAPDKPAATQSDAPAETLSQRQLTATTMLELEKQIASVIRGRTVIKKTITEVVEAGNKRYVASLTLSNA